MFKIAHPGPYKGTANGVTFFALFSFDLLSISLFIITHPTLGPCLVAKNFAEFFKIPCHIESLTHI
jgi:hypothetical protein